MSTNQVNRRKQLEQDQEFSEKCVIVDIELFRLD